MISRISILGTGLLGTSVGLALRAAGFKGPIVGWNRSAEQAQLALSMGAIDSIAADPIEVARAGEVTVLSVPIFATVEFMEKLAPVLGPDHLVTDVGSTKKVIAEAATRLYNAPGRAAFLPGHPMAGKERGGASLADANLFRRAVWLFTPEAGSSLTKHDVERVKDFESSDSTADKQEASGHDLPGPPATGLRGRGGLSRAVNVAGEPRASAPGGISARGAELIHDWRTLVAAMGAKTLDLEPTRHDELVAWVSHLPQFTATALSALLEEEVGDAPELKDVGGRALREMTRLGSSPFNMWRDIAHTNTEAVERALLGLEQRLALIRENLRTPVLRDEFERANKFRRDQ
jgi:prephenate dehydrogenase